MSKYISDSKQRDRCTASQKLLDLLKEKIIGDSKLRNLVHCQES